MKFNNMVFLVTHPLIKWKLRIFYQKWSQFHNISNLDAIKNAVMELYLNEAKKETISNNGVKDLPVHGKFYALENFYK